MRIRVIAVGIVALSGCLIGADSVVGHYVQAGLSDRVACRLGVTNADVQVDGWPRTKALVTGEIPRARIDATGVEFAGVEADVDLVLQDIERTEHGLSSSGGTASVLIGYSQLLSRVGKSGAGLTLTGGDDEVVATMGRGLSPVALVLRPTLVGTTLSFVPSALRIGSREVRGPLATELASRLSSRVKSSKAARFLEEGVSLELPPSLAPVGVTATDAGLALELTVAEGRVDALGRHGRC